MALFTSPRKAISAQLSSVTRKPSMKKCWFSSLSPASCGRYLLLASTSSLCKFSSSNNHTLLKELPQFGQIFAPLAASDFRDPALIHHAGQLSLTSRSLSPLMPSRWLSTALSPTSFLASKLTFQVSFEHCSLTLAYRHQFEIPKNPQTTILSTALAVLPWWKEVLYFPNVSDKYLRLRTESDMIQTNCLHDEKKETVCAFPLNQKQSIIIPSFTKR